MTLPKQKLCNDIGENNEDNYHNIGLNSNKHF